jgi:hypothetical protein
MLDELSVPSIVADGLGNQAAFEGRRQLIRRRMEVATVEEVRCILTAIRRLQDSS